MNSLISKNMKRGIALFGGNFVLPFENQIHLSNSLSVQYLQFCQKYNSTQQLKIVTDQNKKQPSRSSSTPKGLLAESQHMKLPKYYEFLVLAPRKCEMDSEKQRDFYDIATIVNLEQCSETGAIKALSNGVDSLVRIKMIRSQQYQYANQYTSDNRLIVENDPHTRLHSVIKTADLPFVVHEQRKLFFCDYEPLHERVPKYTDKEKDHFIRSICNLAQKTNYQKLIQKEFLENLAADQKNSMFPRLQLFQLLKHLDQKYYFNRHCSEWLDQKYEILRTKNDEQILQTLLFVSNQLTV